MNLIKLLETTNYQAKAIFTNGNLINIQIEILDEKPEAKPEQKSKTKSKPKPKPMPRSTKAECIERLKFLKDLMNDGATGAEIKRQYMEKYDRTDSTYNRDLGKARELYHFSKKFNEAPKTYKTVSIGRE